MFNVYLDDVRLGPFNEIHDQNNMIFPDWNNWIICRSVEQVKYLLLQGVVKDLSLDHDLGLNKLTGYDLCKWMVENDCFPKGKITIHSQNPVGALNCKALIDNYFLHNSKG